MSKTETAISELKKNILDIMRHNNYVTAKFEIGADSVSGDVNIVLKISRMQKRSGKLIKIVEVEKL